MVPVVIRNLEDSLCVISQEEKDENRGSVEFQIVSFTKRIRKLTSHLQLHKKKLFISRGLRKILEKRQRLLSYLSKKNRICYKKLINRLDIRSQKLILNFNELCDLLVPPRSVASPQRNSAPPGLSSKFLMITGTIYQIWPTRAIIRIPYDYGDHLSD
ncbi:hypothetical protein DVH24_040704 [Malus domestica]|uniref:Small ribosomal subunit protein uS15c n=1 Tax=Malus domestica TaxID=3750 RepID=A0A498IC22_MALDO|nr:hypothetical protein DVH24_040704 [Malus domestica]